MNIEHKKQVRAVIDRALELVSTGWTQGAFARVAPKGNQIGCYEENARCFCTVGALKRASAEAAKFDSVSEEWRLLEDAACEVRAAARVFDLVNWNDDPIREKEEVLQAFRNASANVFVMKG